MQIVTSNGAGCASAFHVLSQLGPAYMRHVLEKKEGIHLKPSTRPCSGLPLPRTRALRPLNITVTHDALILWKTRLRLHYGG